MDTPRVPLLTIGRKPDHGFDAPLGLLSDCHRRIEHFLNVLTSVVDARSGGALSSMDRDGLSAALAYFATAAPTHTADEEESLFPRLRRSADAATQDALAVIDRLERDHGIADEHHAAVDAIVHRWLAADALEPCDVETLRGHLVALRTLYEPHIALEDRELFVAASRLLSADELAAVGREMAARRAATRARGW